MTFNINKAVSKTFNESEDSKDGITNPEDASPNYNDENQPEANVLITNEAGSVAAECPEGVIDRDDENQREAYVLITNEAGAAECPEDVMYRDGENQIEIEKEAEDKLACWKTIFDVNGESVTIFALDESDNAENIGVVENICSTSLIEREGESATIYALDESDNEINTAVESILPTTLTDREGRIVPHELDVCHNKFSSTVRSEQKNLYACDVRQIRENSHKDNECERMIEQNGQLKRYQETHSGERHFLCELCDKAFERKYDLKKHMICHSEKRHFTCDTCGRGFAHKYKLNEHMVCHSGKRPFTCDKCGAAFVRKSNLKHHMISHSKESNFVCDICERTYKFKCSLTRHKRIHSQDRLHI